MLSRIEERQWQSHFTGWGAQTIIYAMLVKAEGLGRRLKPSTDVEYAASAHDEALKIAQLDLWPKAMRQTGNKLTDDTGVIFSELVLNWCAKHMGYTKPSRVAG